LQAARRAVEQGAVLFVGDGVRVACPGQLAVQRGEVGGQGAELYCEGGEAAFLAGMAEESRAFATQVFWFTTLVSKASNLPNLQERLKTLGASDIRVVDMAQGQKQSR
ncbi:RlmF-related methyltransferase, partial [Escherichia coli]